MSTLSLAEQAAEFSTATFKDGDAADGEPTAEEQAAHELNTRPMGGAAALPADADPDDDATEGDDETPQEGAKPAKPAEGDAEKPAEKPKKATPSERIGDLTAKWRGAERTADTEKQRADRAEAELAALKSGKTPLTPPAAADTGDDAPPDPSKFDYGELDPKYIAALSRHETRQALKEERANDEKTRQATAAAAEQREQVAKQADMVKAGVLLHDDFDEVVMQGAREGKWQLSRDLGVLLLDSEFGAEIAYELAKDPEEADRVFKLSPAKQAAYLGRKEATIEAARAALSTKVPKTPQAQTPPKLPKGGSGSNKVAADSSDFAAVEAAYKSGALR